MDATPTLETLDPATLTVDVNVRKDAALTADFIASIKEHGVMEPVIAHRKEDGVVHVLMGQRRTRAAVEAERPLIPVMLIESPEEAERIVTQVVENIQRAELTEADEADAYHQLSLIGVSAAAIARKTGRTKTTVESALKAKSTDTGAAALGKGCTVEEALILAEFESHEDATEELESVIRDEPDMLAHLTQQLRDKRDRAAALAALTAELEAAGTTVVESAGYDGDSENVRVSSLNRADGEPATDEDANAVAITTSYNGTHSTVPVIAGWKELGYTLRYSGYGTSSAPKGPMTEEQKAERKTLIENNKLMQSAMITALSTPDVNPLIPSWGILGFMLALNAVLFIASLVSIARNRIHSTGGTIVWALIVLSVPVLGSLLWFLIGRRELLGARLRDQAR